MKNIRKILILIMVMVLSALIYSGCGAGGSSANSLTGSWKCSALDMGSGDVLKQLGSSYSENIVFYALDDGNCLLDMAGQQLPMTWKWMKENKQFIRLLDTLAFETWKNNRWTEDKVDAKFVRNLLEEQGYGDLPFTAGELLKYWQRGPLYSKKKR